MTTRRSVLGTVLCVSALCACGPPRVAGDGRQTPDPSVRYSIEAINGKPASFRGQTSFLFVTSSGSSLTLADEKKLRLLLEGYTVAAPNGIKVAPTEFDIRLVDRERRSGNVIQQYKEHVITVAGSITVPNDWAQGEHAITISFPTVLIARRALQALTPTDPPAIPITVRTYPSEAAVVQAKWPRNAVIAGILLCLGLVAAAIAQGWFKERRRIRGTAAGLTALMFLLCFLAFFGRTIDGLRTFSIAAGIAPVLILNGILLAWFAHAAKDSRVRRTLLATLAWTSVILVVVAAGAWLLGMRWAAIRPECWRISVSALYTLAAPGIAVVGLLRLGGRHGAPAVSASPRDSRKPQSAPAPVVMEERQPEAAAGLEQRVAELSRTTLSLLQSGDYQTARSVAADAFACAEQLGQGHPDFTTCLSNLAFATVYSGDWREAKPLVDRVLALRRAELGADHPEFVDELRLWANNCFESGLDVLAEPLLRQVLESSRSRGEDDLRLAEDLHNLGTLYIRIGRTAEAESLLQQAHRIYRRNATDPRGLASNLAGLAAVSRSIGDHGTAVALLTEALEIHAQDPQGTPSQRARLLVSLAGRHYDQGRFDEALRVLREATAILKPLPLEIRTYLQCLLAQTEISLRAGLFDAARSHAEEAKGLSRRTFGLESEEYARSLLNLAAFHHQTGDFDRALTYSLIASTPLAGKHDLWHPYILEALFALATAEATNGRTSRAIEKMKEAARHQDRLLSVQLGSASERQRLEVTSDAQIELSLFLSLASQQFDDPSARSAVVRDALDLTLRRKALAAEAASTQRETVLGGDYPDLQEMLTELTALRMRIARARLDGAALQGREAGADALIAWEARKEELEQRLGQQIPEMGLDAQIRAADRQAVALALPPDSVLVEFARFEPFDFKAIRAKGQPQWKPARYVAFTLPARQADAVQLIDLGEAEGIDQMIATFRRQITSDDAETRVGGLPEDSTPEAPPSAAADGFALRQAIFDPLVNYFQGRTRLLLAPDGDLTRLPFEVLPTSRGRRLIHEFRISYLGVARDALRFGAMSRTTAGDPVVLADPSFDLATTQPPPAQDDVSKRGRLSREADAAALEFASLPGSRVEGQRIATMLRVSPWLEADALEGRLKAVRSPRILHLATHGFFLPNRKSSPESPSFSARSTGEISRSVELQNPLLRSGLALAGANWRSKGFAPPSEAEDGLLTAEDVSALDLRATELAVLSACQTGLGELRTGEGVLGLRRAFMLAGASTLVMSLWNVPDLATAVLMERFYQNLLSRRMPRDEALRDAQLHTRDVTVGELRDRWLAPEVIDGLAAGREELVTYYRALARRSDEFRPFTHPVFWGAFICQGDPSPLADA